MPSSFLFLHSPLLRHSPLYPLLFLISLNKQPSWGLSTGVASCIKRIYTGCYAVAW